MYGRGMLVHCPCRLGAAVAVLAAEVPCGNGALTEWTLKQGKAVHHFDGVMSHSFDCSRLSRDNSELKLPPSAVTSDSRFDANNEEPLRLFQTSSCLEQAIRLKEQDGSYEHS